MSEDAKVARRVLARTISPDKVDRALAYAVASARANHEFALVKTLTAIRHVRNGYPLSDFQQHWERTRLTR